MPDRERRTVVAAVIEDDGGRVLLARRRPGTHLAGLWEFPGGGVEAGETAEEALVRELEEELGVVVEVRRPRTFAWHRDERREVLLLFYDAALVEGEPRGAEGQQVRWFARDELVALQTPPADRALVESLAAGSAGAQARVTQKTGTDA